MACKNDEIGGNDPWVIQVEESLDAEGQPDSRSLPNIFRVPKTLLNENKKAYIPQVISLGPYHFKETKRLDEMEMLKSQVARKMHQRLIDRRKHDFKSVVHEIIQQKDHLPTGFESVVDETIQQTEHGFKSIVNMIERREEDIRHCYDEEITPDRKVLSWMMARDVCLVLEVLKKYSDTQEGDTEWREWPRIDRILNRKRYHPLLNEIVKDMFKMENQLPLWLLLDLFRFRNLKYEDYFKKALENLTPLIKYKPSTLSEVCDLSQDSHLLKLLHGYIVGRYSKTDGHTNPAIGEAAKGDASKLQSVSEHTTLSDFLLCCVPLLIWQGCKKYFAILLGCMIILVCSPCCIPWLIWQGCKKYFALPKSNRGNVPSAEELSYVGVEFKKCSGGISEIRFEKKSSTLYLPHFKVDERSEVLLRNLMALEISSQEKPITRYAIFMNDLINNSRDVSIFRKYDIIVNQLGSDEEAAKLWNCITKSMGSPAFRPIDDAAKQVNAYRKRKLKVLWAQFRMIHCSEPWVVVSVVAATFLLLMTVVQVACLFHSCMIK
eukprot:Gb_15961 [translate_table: standard]